MPDKPQDEKTALEPERAPEGEPEAQADTEAAPGNQEETPALTLDQEHEGDVNDAGAEEIDGGQTSLVALAVAEIEENRFLLLNRSIIKAQSLLAFSAEANVTISTQIIDGITNAQRTFGKSTWTPNIETSFWSAFRELSGHLDPVTYESLQWVKNRGRKITWRFIWLGIASLLALILAQVFWVYINNTSTQINTSIQRLNEKSAELLELENGALLISPAPSGAEDEARNFDERIATTIGRMNVLKNEIEQIQRLLAAQYIILADWVPEFSGDPKPDDPGWFDSDEEAAAKRVELEKWYALQKTERGFEKEYLLAQAASILALMSTYFLPLLYGALGTVAYILRSVSRGIRERVLNDALILNFWVRVPLGMLSGVAIGLFLNVDSLPTGWEAVQPLAFAFVAGYSVELIFTAMDRVVGAFTARNQPGTP